MKDNKPNCIIFLDLDHVLTNVDVDNTSFLSYDPSRYRLSKANLKNFSFILEKTGAKVVVASNWRKFKAPHLEWLHRGKKYFSILEAFKKLYADEIVGMLPVEHGLTKCECLELWFEDNPWLSKHGRYAILEDDVREGYQAHPIYSKHLVLTDYHVGLTKDDAERAVEMLRKGEDL